MVVVFTFTKIDYLLVGLFYNLVRPLFVFIFVVINSLAALFALFSAEQEKQSCLPQSYLPYCSRRPSGQVIFKQNIPFDSVLLIDRFIVLF